MRDLTNIPWSGFMEEVVHGMGSRNELQQGELLIAANRHSRQKYPARSAVPFAVKLLQGF